MPRRELSNLSEIWQNPFEKNEKLFEFIAKEKANGSKIIVLSNVAQYNFDQIFSKEDQAELFDLILLSGNLGVSKPSDQIFKIAEEEIRKIWRGEVSKSEELIGGAFSKSENLKLEDFRKEIIFVDDSVQNVEAAQKLGWCGIVYRDFAQFEKETEEF